MRGKTTVELQTEVVFLRRKVASLRAQLQAAREAMDESQALIRRAAPLSWAAGSSLEQNAYEWEKEAMPVLARIDAALAALDKEGGSEP